MNTRYKEVLKIKGATTPFAPYMDPPLYDTHSVLNA